MKKNYYLVLDVETANHADPLMYDIGFVVTDIQGIIYEKHSYINEDIFYYENKLMQSAYYAEKIPSYMVDIAQGTRTVLPLSEIKKIIHNICKNYNIKAVCAYNAGFDTRALDTTQRWLTKSKYRYFLPKQIEIHDIWHMACQVICSQNKYYNFCIENELVSEKGNISTSAETVYKFLTNDPTFQEEHKGLDDVLIETEIMKQCYKKKKKMNKQIYTQCWRIPQKKKK